MPIVFPFAFFFFFFFSLSLLSLSHSLSFLIFIFQWVLVIGAPHHVNAWSHASRSHTSSSYIFVTADLTPADRFKIFARSSSKCWDLFNVRAIPFWVVAEMVPWSIVHLMIGALGYFVSLLVLAWICGCDHIRSQHDAESSITHCITSQWRSSGGQSWLVWLLLFWYLQGHVGASCIHVECHSLPSVVHTLCNLLCIDPSFQQTPIACRIVMVQPSLCCSCFQLFLEKHWLHHH